MFGIRKAVLSKVLLSLVKYPVSNRILQKFSIEEYNESYVKSSLMLFCMDLPFNKMVKSFHLDSEVVEKIDMVAKRLQDVYDDVYTAIFD